ncbi:sensor histidine kinase [Cohnella phaseoli]|uniref:Two-component system sensor histidine kinase YesM n=1 Tax=Cohnella phaseoli TaxID=456490 RepID=A0A3D9IJV8_9BACL|nr:sensor histidine kinase [Cohnella phaseoli]RED61937.1 two-component system sensor histidine kinase YesM [Cohnella phaseoli]
MFNGNNFFRSRLGSASPILRRISIKNRLLAAFLITSLLPVLFVAFYSNYKYENSITEKISASTQQVLNELAQNMMRELEQYETLSEAIIINKSIQGALPKFEEMTDFQKNNLRSTLSEELAQQIFRLSNIANVVIFTNEGQPIFDLGFEWYPDIRLDQLTDSVESSSGNASWTYLRTYRGANRIALTRAVYAEDNLNRKLGYIMILIDEKVFSRNTYSHVELGQGSRIYVADKNGFVVSSVAPEIEQGSDYGQNEIFAKLNKEHKNEAFYTQVNDRKTLVVSSYIRSADWELIGLVPHSFLVSELKEMRGNIVFICLLTLMLSGGLAMWIYFSIHSPMRLLLQYANQIRLGQLETKIGNSYPDEMGKLTETIDKMVEQLKLLIFQVESEQQAKRDAELKMLQAQINPHFLFNTLNSLKWSAMMSGNETVRQGIESLSELLRNTILVKEELIPLEMEIDNLLHYATIQRIRYGDSFKLSCAMSDDELYACLVPKFILQPIVENSILHAGNEDGRRVGIRVEGVREGATLKIVIADDGKGFDMNDAQNRKSSSHAKLSGIGIGNVDERIRLHFGAAYGLVTRSAPNEGTETEIKLPILAKEERSDV